MIYYEYKLNKAIDFGQAQLAQLRGDYKVVKRRAHKSDKLALDKKRVEGKSMADISNKFCREEFNETTKDRDGHSLNKCLINRIKKDQSGLVRIKTLIIIAVSLFCVWGLVNIGLILNGYLTLNVAAKEGARLAIVSDRSPASIEVVKEVVINYADDFKLEDDDIVINFAGEIGGQTQVTVTGDVDLLYSFPPFPESVSINGNAVMRQIK